MRRAWVRGIRGSTGKRRDRLDNWDPDRDTNGMAIARALSNELQAGTWWRGTILAARWRGW